MHGSLIDSHHRLSLNSNDPGILSSSSEYPLTDGKQISKSAKDNQSMRSSLTSQSQTAASNLGDTVKSKNENKTNTFVKDSTNFFRWTPGYKHMMLTYCTICLFAFMTGVEYAVILPTVYDYVRKMTNADIYVGLILSSYSISGSITGIIMGKISDMTGKVKILILISSIFEIGGNTLYFIANNIYIVLLGRLVAGVGMGAVPPILADVAHRTTEIERTKAISIILGCRQLGLLIGPCFTILIRSMNFHIGSIRVYNLNGPGFLMAIVWLFLMLVCWFCFYDRKPSINISSSSSSPLSNNQHSTKETVKQNSTCSNHSLCQGSGRCTSLKLYYDQYMRLEMFVLFFATFITYFNQTALETIVAAFTEKHFYWNSVHISILFALAGLEIILVYFSLVKIFSKRCEDRMLLIFGIISLNLACILGAFFTVASQSFGWFTQSSTNIVNKRLLSLFIIFVILDLLGLPFIAVTSVSLFTKLTVKELQGFSQGLQRFIMGVGTIAGPLFASLLLNRLHIMMTIMLMLTSFTLIAVVFVIKRLRAPLQKNLSTNINDVNVDYHHSSLEDNPSGSKSTVPTKSCYVALVHHDEEQHELLCDSQSDVNTLAKSLKYSK